MKKMYTFEFSKEGLEEAINFKEENNIIKYAPLALMVIGAAYLIATIPASTVAFKPLAAELSKEAIKMTISGGAI